MSERVPDFTRLLDQIGKAENYWRLGERDKARSLLKLVASLCYADAQEPDPFTPVATASTSGNGVDKPTTPVLVKDFIGFKLVNPDA